MLQDMNGSQEKVNGALTDEILEPYNGWPNDGAVRSSLTMDAILTD